jgi:hypothetical protein
MTPHGIKLLLPVEYTVDSIVTAAETAESASSDPIDDPIDTFIALSELSLCNERNIIDWLEPLCVQASSDNSYMDESILNNYILN